MLFLIRSLRVNGLFSIGSGSGAIAFARPLADVMEVPLPVVLIVGVGVLAFGVSIVWSTRTSSVDPLFALTAIVSDAIWVIGALVVLAIPGSMNAKWILGLVSVPVAVFAVLQSIGLARLSSEGPKRLETEVEIAATPSSVWSVITDLDSYSEWNPFIIDAVGDPTLGSRLDVEMQLERGRAMRFRPIITKSDAPNELEWLGHLGLRGLLDGRHRFELIPSGSGTRLRHSEEFTGLLVPLVSKSLDKGTLRGFKSMNQALKGRIESANRD